jgi:hypothetical protein
MPPTDGPSVLDTNPHLAHYIFKLVLSNAQLTAAAAGSGVAPRGSLQHPLSVSSSGESDDDSDDSDDENEAPADLSSTDGDSSTGSSDKANAHKHRSQPPALGPSREDREELTRKVISLLDNDQEEDVKDVLRAHMGEMGKVSHTTRVTRSHCTGRHSHGPSVSRLHAQASRWV